MNDLLAAMSGEANADEWTGAALESPPRWGEVRSRTRAVLAAV